MAKKRRSSSKELNVNKKTFYFIAAAILVAVVLTVAITGFPFKVSESKVLATVNNKPVTEDQMLLSKEVLETQSGSQVGEDIALEHAVVQELMVQEAKARGFSVSKKDAEERLSEFIASQGKNLEDEKQRLESQGEDYDSLLEEYRSQIMVGLVLEDEITPVQPTEEEAMAFYEENKETFKKGEEYVSFETLEPQIMSAIVQQKARNDYIEFVNSLKENAEIVYLEN